MIVHMCKVAVKTHACLPYGMLSTLIFQEFGVQISNQEPKRILRHTDHYNLKILHRMGYKKDGDQWIRKKGKQRK